MRPNHFLSARIGILAMLCALAVASSSAAQVSNEKVIYSFSAAPDGNLPESGLTFDVNGNLYGTTVIGGSYGLGTVFELKHTANGWTEAILYSFTGHGDGVWPSSSVIFDKAGNLYGTTCSYIDYCGYGNVFMLTPDSHGGWTETVLYSFTGGDDGFNPQSDLVFDAQGNLFGTTVTTVFELVPQANGTWKEVTLHHFSKVLFNGWGPFSGVVLDTSGNVWGTTQAGGVGNCEWTGSGCGVVYELSAGSDGKWKETVIYDFPRGGGRGVNPAAGFLLGKDGELFGTTLGGGDGMGTVFELTQSQTGWEQHVLYRFYGYPDGELPLGRLEMTSAGTLFGTTVYGGEYGYGTVFEVGPPKANGGRETVLHSFAAGSDGAYPFTGVISDLQGHLYGTTWKGGSTACADGGCGTVFEITLGGQEK